VDGGADAAAAVGAAEDADSDRSEVKSGKEVTLMPGGDRTGPLGMGPMTGRAAGYCAGYGVPGYMNPWPGRGFWGWGRGFWGRGRGFWGWGRGFGRGWRNWYYATGLTGWQRAALGWGAPWYGAPPTPEDEREALRAEAQALERELGEIRRRLDELESSRKAE